MQFPLAQFITWLIVGLLGGSAAAMWSGRGTAEPLSGAAARGGCPRGDSITPDGAREVAPAHEAMRP